MAPKLKVLISNTITDSMRFGKEKTSFGSDAAPLTIGTSENIRGKISSEAFYKTPQERGEIAKAKKEHNKRFFKLFGTKRPTAGIVKRHFSADAVNASS